MNNFLRMSSMLSKHFRISPQVLRQSAAMKTIVCLLFLTFFSGLGQRAEAVEPKIATGLEYTLYLAPDGRVWGWGDNSAGQLGVGDQIVRTSPTQIPGLTQVVAIACGIQHSLALRADGTVWAWGRNSEGQVGLGATSGPVLSPTKINSLSGIGKIAAGGYHSFALAAPSGATYAWGYNFYGQLGNGNNTQQPSPVSIGYSFKEISGGVFHTLAINFAGAPYAWGLDNNGQLGDGVFLINQNVPTAVAGGYTDIVSISAGAYHSIMCRSLNNQVLIWGDDLYGQVGNGVGQSDQPTPYATPYRAWKVVAGFNHSYLLYPGGYIYAVGDNSQGQCRIDPSSVAKRETITGLGWFYPRPNEIVGGLSNHFMFTDSSGQITGWGDNSQGQLGLNSTYDYTFNTINTPAQWSLDVFTKISAGNSHTLALKADGTVWAWGSDGNGQLGDDGALVSKNTPVQVGISSVMQVCAGGYHSLALTTNGAVYAWGWDGYGQLGNDASYVDSPTPIYVNTGGTIKGLGAGAYHSLAIDADDGRVYAWGANSSGQLGNATNTQSPTPVTVSGLIDVEKVEAGYQHSVALKLNTEVWGWGADWAGQLGNDVAFSNSTVPVQATLSSFIDVAAGQSHTTCPRTSGLTRAWGADSSGQLGNGATTGNQPTATLVSGSSILTRASAGADFADFSIYLANDGTVFACGYDFYGQLGNDVSFVNQTTAVQVASILNICEITAGDYHSHALGADGTLYSWGYNSLGQLGNGVTGGNQPTPITVTSNTWLPLVSVTVPDSNAGEGGGNTGTFRFFRSFVNAGAVTVSYSLAGSTATNGSDFSNLSGTVVIPPFSSFVDLVVTPIDDFVDEDNETVNLTITTGQQYRIGSPSSGSMTISDNDTSGFTVSPISANTEEADQGSNTARTFTIRLNSQPSGNVVLDFSSSNTAEGRVDTDINPGNQNASQLTFTSFNWNIPRTVEVFGQDDNFDDGDINYSIIITVNVVGTLDPRYDPLDPPDVAITNKDDDTAGVLISAISGPVTEAGGTATFSITLTSRPYNSVSFDLNSNDLTEGILQVGSSSVTITPAEWNTGKTITVLGVDDSIDDDDVAFKINIDKSISSDPAYNNLGGWQVDVTCTDDDTKGVSLSTTSINATEGGASTTYTLNLTSRPIGTANVTLLFSGGAQTTVDADLATPGIQTSLVIPTAEWQTLRTITVTAIDDPDIEGAHLGTITTTVQAGSGDYSIGVTISDVSCSIVDNDNAGITIAPITTPGSRQVTSESGSTATYSVRLNTRPAGGDIVRFRINTDDLTEGRVGATPIELTSTTTTGLTNRINFADATDLSALVVGWRITILGSDANANTQTTITDFSNSPPKYIDVSADLADATVEPVRIFPGPATSFTLSSTSANNGASQFYFADGVDLSAVEIGASIAIETSTNNQSFLGRVTAIDNLLPVKSITVQSSNGGPAVVDYASPETIRIISPMILTFSNADWNVEQFVTVTGINDAANDGDINYSIELNIDSTTTDNYYLPPDYNPPHNAAPYFPAATQYQYMKNLDDDVPGVAIVQSQGTTVVSEANTGFTDSFTVRLNTDPGGVAVVTLSTNGQVSLDKTTLVFTTSGSNMWSTPQTVTVSALNDAIDEAPVHAGIITFSISGYGGIITADPVVALVGDDDSSGITISPTSLLITTEDGFASNFSMSLQSQPTTNVTIGLTSLNTNEGTVSPASLTFTPTNWYIPQSATVTGVNDDFDDGDQVYIVQTAAAVAVGESSYASYNGLNPNDITLVNIDNDSAGVTITQTGGSTDVTEGGATDTFSVVLTTRPQSGDVTVTLSQGSQVTLSSTTLTFTATGPTAWNVPQVLTVTAFDDNVAEGAHSTSIGISASGTGYSGLSISPLLVSITDNDNAGTTVSAAALTTTESGGTDSFTMHLNTQPTGNVTVILTSTNTAEGTVSPSSLTFTPGNYASDQIITLSGIDDDVDDGDIDYAVTFTLVSADSAYNGLPVADKSVTNTDNDAAGFIISSISNNLKEDGTSGRFTVRLNSEPTDTVTIGVTVGDATEADVALASLSFDASNWDQPQEVTVSGVDDNLRDGDIVSTIVLSPDTTTTDTQYINLDPNDVSVTTQDDDQVGVLVSTASIQLSENGFTTVFSVQLASEPDQDVTIPISSSDTTEATVDTASLTFTPGNWNIAQNVTVTPVDDDVVDGDIAFIIDIGTTTTSDTTGYVGIDPDDISVTNDDDDVASIELTKNTASTSETTPSSDTIDIVLTSQPTADVTLTITGLDSSEGSLSATVLTFTPTGGTAWNIPQTLTISGVNDDLDDGDVLYNLTVTPTGDATYAALSTENIAVTNSDNDTASVLITESSGTTVVAETGATDTYTIALTSQPTVTTTITVTPDSQVLVNNSATPIILTFDPGLTSPDPNGWDTVRTITVKAVVDTFDEANPHTATITHTVSGYVDQNSAAVTASPVSVTVNDNDPPQVTVTSLTVGRASSDIITPAMISATDDDTAAANLVFSIVLAPGQGDLYLDYGLGTEDLLVNGETFLQSDITSGRLSYHNSGTPNVSDGFAFRVLDAVGNQSDLTIFNITITGFIPPTITLNGIYAPTYNEDDPAVAVDTGPSVSDPDSTYYSLLTVSMTGGTADDVITIATVGNVVANAGTVSYSGSPIGTYAGGTGVTPLTVTFSASAAGDAQLTDLIIALRFRNTSQDPVAGVRTISLVLRDETGTENVAVTKDIDVFSINDAPVISDATLITPKNVAVGGVLSVDDVDNYPLTLTVTSPPGKGTLTGVLDVLGPTVLANGLSSRAFTYTPTAGQEGIDSFVVQVEDPDGAIDTATITVLITGGSAARPWVISDPPVETESGSPLSYDVVVDFSELPTPPTLPSEVTYTLVGTLPAGVTFGGFTPNGTNANLTLTIGSGASGVIEAGIVVTETASNTSGYQPITIQIVAPAAPGG